MSMSLTGAGPATPFLPDTRSRRASRLDDLIAQVEADLAALLAQVSRDAPPDARTAPAVPAEWLAGAD